MSEVSRPRLAALDLGTNSFHVVVAELSAGAALRTVAREKTMLRLGDEVGASGRIGVEAQERALDAIRTLSQVARAHGADRIQASGTAALREAENGAEFVRRIRRETGIEVEVISGEREARLIYRAVQTSLDFGGRRALVVDVGGGSVEFGVGDQSTLDWAASVPLGVGRLTARFVQADPVSPPDRKLLRKHVRSALKPLAAEAQLHGFDFCVATSGTLLALIRLTLDAAGIEVDSLEGARVGAVDLLATAKSMGRSSARERHKLDAIEDRRADLMPAAGILVGQILDRFPVEEVVASTQGLREGLLISQVAHPALAGRDPATIRARSVHALARHHHVEEMHARQTARLSGVLFDALGPVLGLDPARRELLLHAAELHDIGNTIARKGHHKHGAYIVRHSELAGFEPEERALLGALIRYHRSGKPKLRHPEFEALAESTREELLPLLAILRVADGLDASREANVLDLGVDVHDDALVIRIRSSTGDPGLDLWGGRRKAALLEKVSGRTVSILGPEELRGTAIGNGTPA